MICLLCTKQVFIYHCMFAIYSNIFPVIILPYGIFFKLLLYMIIYPYLTLHLYVNGPYYTIYRSYIHMNGPRLRQTHDLRLFIYYVYIYYVNFDHIRLRFMWKHTI